MENNDYYEPTIKINGINDSKVEINFDNYIEKQQLISFLENEIKEIKKIKAEWTPEADTLALNYLVGRMNTFQEVLDLIKGDKQ